MLRPVATRNTHGFVRSAPRPPRARHRPSSNCEHRRATLPERDQRGGAPSAGWPRWMPAWPRSVPQRDDVARTQKRLEDEVAGGRDQGRRRARPSSTAGRSPHRASCRHCRTTSTRSSATRATLEDKVLEQMELAVPLDVELGELTARRAALAEELTATESQHHRRRSRDRRPPRRGRAPNGRRWPPRWRRRWWSSTSSCATTSAASRWLRWWARNCGGCHLTLSAVELDRVRHQPEGTLVFCGECGRLLVR